METWKHVRAILALPFMVLIVIPSLLLYFAGVDTLGLWQSHKTARVALPSVGGLLMVGGLALMFTTIRWFVIIGKGTLAPWNPTDHLVVKGIYRHVRNPMITGVVLVLLGEATASASVPLLVWAMLFIIANIIFIPLFEEPGLVKRFGKDYQEYRRNVPRWIPRWTPWE